MNRDPERVVGVVAELRAARRDASQDREVLAQEVDVQIAALRLVLGSDAEGTVGPLRDAFWIELIVRRMGLGEARSNTGEVRGGQTLL